jgi:hypothetical protein
MKNLRKQFPRPSARYNAGGEMEWSGYSEYRIDKWLEEFDNILKEHRLHETTE